MSSKDSGRKWRYAGVPYSAPKKPTQPPPPSIAELVAHVSRQLNGLDQAEPIAAIVIFKVEKSKEREFRRNADTLTAATRRLPGLNVFNYHKFLPILPGDSNEFLIYEEWKTVQFFQAQWHSEHLKTFQQSVGSLLVPGTLPDLRFYHGWQGAEAAKSVFKTGQKRCWDAEGHEIDCAGTGQDGEYQIGEELPRFTDNADGTVTDNLTELTWLKNADRFGEVTWAQALANANNLAGNDHSLTDGSRKGDWRLPNIREILSLLDFSTAAPMIPAGHPFANVHSAIYWSSSTLIAAPTLAWMTTLGIGPSVFDLKINKSRMWPVRGNGRVPKTGQTICWDTNGQIIDGAGTGQDGDLQAGVAPPSPRFTDNSDGTVTDNMTGLVWLKNANAFGFRTWEQALADCNALASGNHGLTDDSEAGDWRLPSIHETESLIDYGAAGPCLPDGGKAFDNLLPSSFWTSTTVASAPTEAMFTILGVGPSIFESKEHPFFVWPVRDSKPLR